MSRLGEIIAPARLGRPFRWNLASVWASNLGDGIALAAGPLLVASLTRNPALIAAAVIVQRAPSLIFSLYAGALADRVSRTRLVVVSNVLRALIVGVLAATVATDLVTIWVVLASLFLVGVAEQFADAGTRSVLPLLVHRDDLAVGNSRVMAGYLVANDLLGPPIGAFLFAAGMALPFGAQAAAVLLAAWLFSRIELPAPDSGERPDTHIRDDIVEGLRWIRHNAPVRTLSIVIFVFNLTWGAPWGILVLWAQERLGVGAVGFGVLSTASAAGGIVAILGFDALQARVSLATLMKVCLALEVVVHLALALTTAHWLALVLMFVFGCYAFVWGSVSTTVRQRATPMEFQGRVGSVYWFGLVAGLLVGQALGGLIATQWGVAAPFWFAFVGAGLTLVVMWRQLDSIAHAGDDDPDLAAAPSSTP
ncbi:antibiotic transporter [Knoellia sinensis KCTC 19936]|uniref:Antibiotic transporter n=1 Tax=Knoellia sinensis KCTC 19936 TaxID=1385520 RepID=A0A0A0J749_9MICO|nr:MFS transporter [Knoellia sinensis]KGN31892.1 antibiotic transporter [Knoellia sinensis KCTC 19936]